MVYTGSDIIILNYYIEDSNGNTNLDFIQKIIYYNIPSVHNITLTYYMNPIHNNISSVNNSRHPRRGVTNNSSTNDNKRITDIYDINTILINIRQNKRKFFFINTDNDTYINMLNIIKKYTKDNHDRQAKFEAKYPRILKLLNELVAASNEWEKECDLIKHKLNSIDKSSNTQKKGINNRNNYNKYINNLNKLNKSNDKYFIAYKIIKFMSELNLNTQINNIYKIPPYNVAEYLDLTGVNVYKSNNATNYKPIVNIYKNRAKYAKLNNIKQKNIKALQLLINKTNEYGPDHKLYLKKLISNSVTNTKKHLRDKLINPVNEKIYLEIENKIISLLKSIVTDFIKEDSNSRVQELNFDTFAFGQ